MKHSVIRHCRGAARRSAATPTPFICGGAAPFIRRAAALVIALAALAASASPPEMVVRLESLRAFDETLWALREQTADRAAAEETMLAQAKLFAGLGIDYMRPDEPILAAFWNLSWPVDLGKLDFLAVLPVRRGSVAPRVRIHLMDEEAQTVGGLTIRPVGPPESDGGAHRRPWIAFDGAQTVVASDPALLAALPGLRAAQPAIPGAPVSVLVPSLERLLLSGGRLVEKDDGESASALGPRTYFLPPEQAIPNELGGTFSIMAAGMRGREAGSLAFGLSATPADGILFATVARPADPANSLYATNPPPPLAAADLAVVPADALVWSASTDGSGRCAGVVSADSIYLGFNDTPANHARKAAFDAFFAALDAASAERGRVVRFLAPAEGGALRWESRVGTRRPDAERKLAAAYAALCRTESEIAGTNTPAFFRTDRTDWAADGLSGRVRIPGGTAASYNFDALVAGLFGDDVPWRLDVGADAAALSIGRGPATDAPAGSAPCDLEAPRRWFPAMEPFRVSALRPAPVLARLGLETDSADDDPVALETFSIVDNSLVWTVSAPPAGVRALSRLVLRFLNPPTPPKTSTL